MPEINRRRFLIASAGVGAAGLLSTAVAVNWHDLMRAAQDRPLSDNAGVLMIVTLYGGNDGINTLIPYADNAYHDARPELAYARAMSCTWTPNLDSTPQCAVWPNCGISANSPLCAA
jgi:uncharacterized protein (DUF1501 family)